MRLELTRVGLLVELANHYTTRGALGGREMDSRISQKYESEVNRKLLCREFEVYSLNPFSPTVTFLEVPVM